MHPPPPLWKKIAIQSIKWGVSIAVIAWLIYKESRDPSFSRLWAGPKDWGLLGVALGICLAAVLITFWRWYLLVRALDIPFTLKDAFRLGFLGFLLNFLSLGIVGGDLFKAFFVAREQPKQRAETVATVVIDRIIGLFALFLVAAAAILISGLWRSDLQEVRTICRAVAICTAVGTLGLVWLLGPEIWSAHFARWISHVPKVGPHAARLLWALRLYRHKLGILVIATLQSVVVQIMFAVCMYVIALALLEKVPGTFSSPERSDAIPIAAEKVPGTFSSGAPTLVEHLVIVPVAMLTAILPLPGNGMGPLEYFLDFLYQKMSQTSVIGGGGLMVALAYHIMTVLIALVGVAIYLGSRREVAAVMHEVEVQDEADVVPDELLTDVVGQGLP